MCLPTSYKTPKILLSEYERKEKQSGKVIAFPVSKKSHPSLHWFTEDLPKPFPILTNIAL